MCEVCRELGISEHSDYRWRKEYGGMLLMDPAEHVRRKAPFDEFLDIELARHDEFSHFFCVRPQSFMNIALNHYKRAQGELSFYASLRCDLIEPSTFAALADFAIGQHQVCWARDLQVMKRQKRPECSWTRLLAIWQGKDDDKYCARDRHPALFQR